MMAEAHRRKAERLGGSLAKCSPEDTELVIDGVMLAITHWINFTFHTLGLTAPDDDIMHCYFVTGFDRQYYGLAADPVFLDALEEIDDLRPLHVRGNASGSDAAGVRALELHEAVRDMALALT